MQHAGAGDARGVLRREVLAREDGDEAREDVQKGASLSTTIVIDPGALQSGV